jgi:transposase
MRILTARSDTRRQILDTASRALYRLVAEVVTVSEAGRLAALERAGLVHPRAGAVTAPLFGSGGFFLAADKVQVKYEMLRAHLADGDPVTQAAAAHGYSRAAFYLVAAAFEQAGMAGLLDERRGRRGPVKLRGEIAEFIRSAPDASGAVLAAQVADRFGVVLHRRTIERARTR